MNRALTLCSFCGKGPDEVKTLIAGPGVHICDSCVATCANVLTKETGMTFSPAAMVERATWESLQYWYRRHCEEQRASKLGIEIIARGSEGWRVVIDLKGTAMAGVAFDPVTHKHADTGWFACKVEENRFHGEGSASALGRIVNVFANWVAAREHQLKRATRGDI
jgi:hypothetical protein